MIKDTDYIMVKDNISHNTREYILGLAVDNVDYQSALKIIADFLGDGRKHLVVTPYSESVVASLKDTEFRKIVNGSSLSVPDGGSLLAASEYLSYQLPKGSVIRVAFALIYGLWVGLKLALAPGSFKKIKERVSGTDLVMSLCGLSAEKGFKVYFLGGSDGVAAAAAGKLKKRYANLVIETSDGPKHLSQASVESIQAEIEKINRFGPDFLFAAFNPVEQEKWLYYHMGEINAKVFMAVGGAFDMILGKTPRAPRFFRRLSIEWLWRLIIEPSRIKRIYNAVIVFPWLVFKSKINEAHH